MAIVFDYEATIRQAEKLENLADRLKSIAESDLEEVLSEVNQGWQGENASRFLGKGDTLKGKVLVSGENLRNIAQTLRRMAENLRESEERAARVAAQMGGGAAQGGDGQ